MGSNLIAGLYLNALKITRIVQLGWGFLFLVSLLRLIHEISIELIHFSFAENLLPVRSVVPQGDTCDRKLNDLQAARKFTGLYSGRRRDTHYGNSSVGIFVLVPVTILIPVLLLVLRFCFAVLHLVGSRSCSRPPISPSWLSLPSWPHGPPRGRPPPRRHPPDRAPPTAPPFLHNFL